MMTDTEYDPRLLEKWQIENEGEKQEWLKGFIQKYLQQFHDVICNKCQWQYFSCFIRGLLSSLDRKSIEPIALYFLGEHTVRSMQQFFSRSPLDEDGILERYQGLLAEQISCEGGMLSVDESCFVKKGINSIGVKRQYCGRLGKQENCQTGVFLAYAGEKGYGFVNRDLYIPKEWYDDEHEALRIKDQLPEEKCFATKNQLARNMLNQVIASNRFSIQWIGCDAAYGNDHAFLDGLELPDKVFRCVSSRSKGSRNYIEPSAEIWLYIRKYENGDIKYFVSNAPQSIPRDELDRAATLRWPIEQCFEEEKSYLGMGHYECRTYAGWMRHMLFVMIAHLFTTKMEEELKKREFL